ncbi:DUF2281 domain-containing protein [Thermodesulfatator atlanticus]|uniref:DUF2281 domain-containing protein n=1 Tax=Thermodesulfatator atlanticus TaxID=501497 RepID=UPI0003B32C0E|nr:DUF2281 domain-containing protein [Thermodesulfatator atlanticus]
MYENEIEAKLKELPEDLRKKVVDYIDTLIQRQQTSKEKKEFNFDWENGLSDLSGDFSAVELQHKALDLR